MPEALGLSPGSDLRSHHLWHMQNVHMFIWYSRGKWLLFYFSYLSKIKIFSNFNPNVKDDFDRLMAWKWKTRQNNKSEELDKDYMILGINDTKCVGLMNE